MTTPIVRPLRPLSPHLQIYRLPVAALISISHRITGVGLTLGIVLLVWWLAAAAYGPDAYEHVRAFIASRPGLVLSMAFSFALCFHLCSGIRHLFWDAGRFFSPQDTATGNILVIVASVLLTLGIWVFAAF